MDDIPTIVKRLTKAQRQAILWMNADGSPRDEVKGSPRSVSFYCLSKVIIGDPCNQIAQIYSICKQGSNAHVKRGIWPVPTWALTPLGIAVRAYITENAA